MGGTGKFLDGGGGGERMNMGMSNRKCSIEEKQYPKELTVPYKKRQ